VQQQLVERQLSQQTLSTELHFRNAMERSLVTGLLAFDAHGTVIYVNLALCRMLRMDRQTLIGCKAPFPFWSQRHLLDCITAHAAMLAGDNPEQGRGINLVDARGQILSVRIFAAPLLCDDGRQTGWMASLYDTTALQKEREALAASREQLYAVLSGLGSAVVVSQISDGRLLFRNRRHAELFRFEADGECCLACWPDLPQRSDQSSPEFFDRQTGNWYQLERRTIVWVDNSPVLLDIVTDISLRRAAADIERERDELLQHTARLASLAEFASGIAHELNQPLTAIGNYSAVARACLNTLPLQTGKIRDTVQRLSEESQRAGKIIHSMRNLLHKRKAPHEQHALSDLLNQSLSRLTPLARKMRITIATDLPAQPVLVECDGVMIEQVLFNLIRNALEAVGRKKHPELQSAVSVKVDRGQESVTVSISDRGPGIADPQKLFQPFYSTKEDGMGLGLAICRTVIESHGGRLWAEANPGGGACFKFRLICVEHHLKG